jgi:hypothetical protein
MFVSPQDGKDSYNPCYIWDVDYSTVAFYDHKNVSRACTEWQFDTTQFGETITGKVRILSVYKEGIRAGRIYDSVYCVFEIVKGTSKVSIWFNIL